jgi:hypothetical protein
VPRYRTNNFITVRNCKYSDIPTRYGQSTNVKRQDGSVSPDIMFREFFSEIIHIKQVDYVIHNLKAGQITQSFADVVTN